MIRHVWRMVLLTVVLGWPIRSGAQTDEFPIFVGREACLRCHFADHDGGVCTVESMPKHDTSYQALLQPEAKSIAALNGVIVPPSQSRLCLGCHATGSDVGRRWWADSFHIEDGVQCEACHAAGSFHVRAQDSLCEHEEPEVHDLIVGNDRARCDPCHVKRPSHMEVLDYGYELPEEDRLYKTPVNLVVSSDSRTLYVVCEHSDSVLVIDARSGRVTDEISVGRRPQDAVLSPDGATLYVTNRLSDTLCAIDTATRKITHEMRIGSEPHAVVPDRSGRFLFVANTSDNSVAVVDTQTFTITKHLSAGEGPWSIAMSSDQKLAFVSNVRPDLARFRDPLYSEITIIDVARQIVVSRAKADAANMLQGIATVPGTNMALFTLTRTKNLIPCTRIEQGWTITNGMGVVRKSGTTLDVEPLACDQVLLDEPGSYFADTTDVAVSPDGKVALVTSGGTNQVAVVDLPALKALIDSSSKKDRRDVLPNHLGLSSQFVRKRVAVGINPRAVAYAPDGQHAYVINALDDSVSVIETNGYTVERTIPLGGTETVTQIRWGERLFHDAVISFGKQFSCRSCHPDGHVNGLTFDIEADGLGMHPVDNRSLRGIFDTPPFKWEGTNPSLSFQCGPRLAVFFTRLEPYTPSELAALVRYMCTIEQAENPNRHPEGLTLQQRRGKAVFERTTTNDGTKLEPQQRCAFCHSGSLLTNRQLEDVGSTMWFDAPTAVRIHDIFNADTFGELGSYYFIDAGTPTIFFDVPHLRSVYSSPPYMHNGAARTLEEIWTRFNMVGKHGVTKDMTREQFNDLIAYLESL